MTAISENVTQTEELVPRRIRSSRLSIDCELLPNRLKRSCKKAIVAPQPEIELTKNNLQALKPKSTVNDLVAQIINDFTTSTIDSRNNSPVVFGDISKLEATKRISVPSISSSIASKTCVTNAPNETIKPKLKAIESLKTMDTLSTLKSPIRAPFMSPRWELSLDEKSVVDPKPGRPIIDTFSTKEPPSGNVWQTNLTIIPKPIHLSVPNKLKSSDTSEKSIFQTVKDKTKVLFGKISKRKSKKLDNQKKKSSATISMPTVTTTNCTIKRPLLRPSILSETLKSPQTIDTTDAEKCLRKLESNSLFIGKDKDIENKSLSNIFANDTDQEFTKNSNIFSAVDLTVNPDEKSSQKTPSKCSSRTNIQDVPKNSRKSTYKVIQSEIDPRSVKPDTFVSNTTTFNAGLNVFNSTLATSKAISPIHIESTNDLKVDQELQAIPTNLVIDVDDDETPIEKSKNKLSIVNKSKSTFARRKMGSLKRRGKKIPSNNTIGNLFVVKDFIL